jgi:hypothetical protein
MTPHYSALRDGNAAAIPSPFLPTGYEPSAFRVSSTSSERTPPASPSKMS